GARVEARSRETGAVREATTDAAGAYRILGLSPGPYDLTARAVGYRPARVVNVELLLGGSPRFDFALEGGAVELEPTIVTATAHGIDRIDASSVILEREIDGLPLNSRDVLSLASIAPGIRSFALKDGRAVPAAGAATVARFVNLYVDGVEWKNFATGALVGQPQAGSLLPQEAVREYRVLLNPYDAEYTRGASWVMSALTHQGGNRVEGSLFAYHQNRQLVARGRFQQGNPDYRRTQLGGNVRGPIVRGRLLYSLSYEGQLTDNVIDVVPGRPPYDPAIWNRYAGSFVAPTANELGMLRLTALAAAHTIDATWLTRYLTSTGNFGFEQNASVLSREAGTRATYRLHNVQLRDRYAGTAALNEITLSLLANDVDDAPVRRGVAIRYPGIQLGRPAFPSTSTGRQIGITDRILVPVRSFGGEHLVKAGVELLHVRGSGYAPLSRDGLFNFLTDTSTRPLWGQIGVGFLHPDSDEDARSPIDGWVVGGYLQDQWRPVPSLTLVLGVRYDAELNTLGQRQPAPWARDTALQRAVGDWYLNGGDRETDLDNVAPRAAIAWDVSGRGRTSLRAGYGVMYDRVPVAGAFSEKQSWAWRLYRINNPGTTDPDSLRRMVTNSGARVAPSITLLPDRMETPSTRQWSAGVSHRMTDRLIVSADYLDQHMRNLPVTVVANALNATGRRPLTTAYGDIIFWGSFGDAAYRALLTSLSYEGDVTRWSAAYTLGSAHSEFGALTTSDFVDSSLYRMQRSDGDERHRVVLSGLTRAPWGVELAAIAVAASPRPFFVIVGTDVNQNGSVTDDWPRGNRTWRRGGWEHWYRTIDVRVARAFPVAHGQMLVSLDAF
ncbi:MAG TPA: carboxypeptidase regulatory-like domain-containing protein, partial [Gemmatimonadaceae bacterium]|nr:carboxypeptidase regulatory-like domain-containing protein [Gemmatimonadaceae bacterium]